MTYTKEQDLEFTNILKQLVASTVKPLLKINAKGRKRDKNPPPYSFLKDFINWKTPLLSDEVYTIQTKIYWIINDIEDWNNPLVHCKNKQCNKPFIGKNVIGIRIGYHEFCSLKCAGNDPSIRRKIRATCYDRFHSSCFLTSEIGKTTIDSIKLEKYGNKNFNNVEKAKETRLKRNNGKYASDALLQKSLETKQERYGNCNYNNTNKAIKTRLRRYDGKYESIDAKRKRRKTNLLNFGVECNLQCEETKAKTSKTVQRKYGADHISKTSYFREKFAKTSMEHFGVPHPMQNIEVQNRTKHRYKFEGILFDSAPEIAFFIYCKEHGKNVQYHNGAYFEYSFDRKTYRYFPDFNVDGILYEIKGLHFFENKDPSKRMICPYRSDGMTDEDYEWLCEKYEAKHLCAIANGVVILTNEKYKLYLDYVENKYGKDYLCLFRIEKSKC